MRLSAAVIALAVLAGGCNTGRLPIQVEAWREVAGPADAAAAVPAALAAMGIVGAPKIHWYGVLDADCDFQAWHPLDDPGVCVGGEELFGVIAVAYIPGKRTVETELSHELGHAWAEEHYGGDGDFNHDRLAEIWGERGIVEIGAEAMGAVVEHQIAIDAERAVSL